MKTAKQVLTELEKGDIWPIYYLYGDEPFKINEFAGRVAEILFAGLKADQAAFCMDRMDGSVANGSDVLEAVQSVGLFGGGNAGGRKRLVVVRQAHQLKDIDSLAQALFDAGKESPWGDNVLVLMAETLDGRRKFHQWIKKAGYSLEFKPPRDAELLQWVHYLAKRNGATVSAEAAEALAILSQGSLHRLSQEIEKAWLYAGAQSGVTLTPEHVSATGSNELAYEMVELVQAILAGKRTRSLLLTEKLIRGSEDALGLVGFLTWAIKNPARGFPTGAREQAPATSRLRKLLHGLIELDFRLKTSGMDPNALVEQFVIEQTETPSRTVV